MAKNLIFPEGYSSPLSFRDTQRAIKIIKDSFQGKLAWALNLERVTAPIIVTQESGINDDLNGVERKVTFTTKEVPGTAEVVQSLAKWKRMALKNYGYDCGEGIYTDMNAIRRDDDCDNLHSIFVDQWDWEKIITRQQRNVEYLKDTVSKIAGVLYDVNEEIKKQYPALKTEIIREVFFITTQELEDMYPDLTPKQRENEITRKYGTVFLMQIGGILKSGIKHDGRASDYDDWSLNGDILVWNDVLKCAYEVSSMGIRVDAESLHRQLTVCGETEREKYPYHQGILTDTLPLTIGGGIGQSRLCMLFLGKAHIGEVQASIWPSEERAEFAKHNIFFL